MLGILFFVALSSSLNVFVQANDVDLEPWNYHSRILVQNISESIKDQKITTKATSVLPSSTIPPAEPSADLEVASNIRSYQIADSPNDFNTKNTFGDFPSFDQVHKENENRKMYSIQQNYADNTANVFNTAVNAKFQNQKIVPYLKQVKPQRPSIASHAIHQTGIFEITDEKQPQLPAKFQDTHKYNDFSIRTKTEPKRKIEHSHANWRIAPHTRDSDQSPSNVNNAELNRHNVDNIKPSWGNQRKIVRKPAIIAPSFDKKFNMKPIMKPSEKDWVGEMRPGGSVEELISNWEVIPVEEIQEVLDDVKLIKEVLPEKVKEMVREEIMDDLKQEPIRSNWMNPVKASEVKEYLDAIKESWKDRTNPNGITDLGGIKTTLLNPKNSQAQITQHNIRNSWKSNNRPTRPAYAHETTTSIWLDPHIKFVPLNDKDTVEAIKTIFVSQPIETETIKTDWMSSMKASEAKKTVGNIKLGGIINNIDDSMAMETKENLDAIIKTWMKPEHPRERKMEEPIETLNYPKIEDIMEITNKTVEVSADKDAVQTTWLVKKKPTEVAEEVLPNVRSERRNMSISRKETSSSTDYVRRKLNRNSNFEPRSLRSRT